MPTRLTAKHLALAASCAALLAAPLAAQTARGISQTDRTQGAKAHPQLLEEFGGAMSGSQPITSPRWARTSRFSRASAMRAAISP